jgi:hypothetical protein
MTTVRRAYFDSLSGNNLVVNQTHQDRSGASSGWIQTADHVQDVHASRFIMNYPSRPSTAPRVELDAERRTNGSAKSRCWVSPQASDFEP